MAEHCCQHKAKELEKLQKRQAKILWIILAINAVMFVVEFSGGIKAASLSLTGDSLDMLGDALVYGCSLFVIQKGKKAQARSAILKGSIMFLTAIAVFARATYQLFAQTVPTVQLMGEIGILALVANLICFLLLIRHRKDNINMSSVWLCSRNDIIANTSVLITAGLVFLTNSFLPDFILGLLLTVIFAQSAGKVLTQARAELI
ncbi:Co/Zn/Cd efflux system component [Hyella patelloides LEGE 07179]|uniref:Co/Zn/Cd efflux system component n=1 Tax=Hyella patelloides LEGE 07179 TaxID=945734 RepID=A0A563VN58_9CYAN|nr:cation transporter [Hyella patelloides]VEP12842.1 Co/Zn/Cd efflux system component [Hyella patelloides LEGE 07179]